VNSQPAINHDASPFIQNKPYSDEATANALMRTMRAELFTNQRILHHVMETTRGRIPPTKPVQSTSMKHVAFAALALSAFTGAAVAEPMSIQADRYQSNRYQAERYSPPAYIAPMAQPPAPQPIRYANVEPDPNLGGGFIEFLFNGGRQPRPPVEMQRPVYGSQAAYSTPSYEPAVPERREIDPKYMKQVVTYHGTEKAGTIIIDTPNRFLFLVQGDGTALRYGIGVGKPGFTWAGVKNITAKKEWPDWTPPPEMLQRRPDLPSWMAGGPENPLGARAMYLGSTLYRIHGSNEPWTIGQAVSSGCIRMRNEDVVDLYERVKVGTKVIVI
jgi:lipoprotein-anchoring transpeptidase ErfK/SrfK